MENRLDRCFDAASANADGWQFALLLRVRAEPPRHKRYGMARRGHLPPRTPVAFALPVSIGHSDDVNQMFGQDNKYPLNRECRRRKITHLAKCRRRSFSLPRAAGLHARPSIATRPAYLANHPSFSPDFCLQEQRRKLFEGCK